MPETINYPSKGESIKAELYSAPARAIIIAYGTDGFTDDKNGPWKKMIEDYANVFARDGFIVLMPHYFDSTGTEPGLPVIAAMFNGKDVWQAALSDAIDYASGRPDVDPARIGLLGFSLGGHLCLRLRHRIPVLVDFFPPVLPQLGGLGSFPGKLKHAQIHHGLEDSVVNFKDNAKQIRDMLEDEGVTTEFYEYPGAGHGFHTESDADKQARIESQARTLSFFREHL